MFCFELFARIGHAPWAVIGALIGLCLVIYGMVSLGSLIFGGIKDSHVEAPSERYPANDQEPRDFL